MKNARRVLFIACGTLSIVLGVIGLLLPVVPTTPFLLLAAFCYARGSRRFHHWLLTNRWCGEYIRNYIEGRGIPFRQKALTIGLLWFSIWFTAGFLVPRWWMKLILLGIAAGVTVHIARIKTYKSGANADPDG